MRTFRDNMKAAAAAAALVALSGCAASSTPIQMPSGAAGHSINCTDAETWSACYTKAAEVCQGAYRVVAKDSGVQGFIVPAAGGGSIGGTYSTREMIIECK